MPDGSMHGMLYAVFIGNEAMQGKSLFPLLIFIVIFGIGATWAYSVRGIEGGRISLLIAPEGHEYAV